MLYQTIIINNYPAAVETYHPPSGCGILYEVIRITDGVFLFLNDHIDRLNHSAKIAGVDLTLPTAGVRKQLVQLLQLNGVQTGNIRMEYYFLSGKVQYGAAFFIRHHYPSDTDYRDGVRACLLVAERANPNAKIVQHRLREQVERIMAEKNPYEVILVHSGGYITEGSRSNIFLVKDGRVYTAPEADVLPGITRKYVLKACSDLSVPLTEIRTAVDRLPEMDAVFIAGTSPKVLPVSQVDEYRFKPDNATIRQIMRKYDEFCSELTI